MRHEIVLRSGQPHLLVSRLRRSGPELSGLLVPIKPGPALHSQQAKTKKAPDNRRFFDFYRKPILLDLGFLEFNMLAHNRIILGEAELLGLGARILLGHIEIAGVSSGLQLDLDNIALGHGLKLRFEGDRAELAIKVKV
jgi:hypothetical protein